MVESNKRPAKQKRRKYNSITSILVKDLADDQFNWVVDRLKLLPEDRPVRISRDGHYSLKNILGDELAIAITLNCPDPELINRLARYVIPDITVRFGTQKERRK